MIRGTRVPALAIAGLLVAPAAGPAAPVDFAREVAPLLERHCVRCHQPGNAKGDISLATAADLLAGEHVVPGRPDDGDFLALVSAAAGKRPQMPKGGTPLAPAEVAVLRRWVAEGAPWPKQVVVKERAKADKSWWSLRPLAAVVPPDPAGLPPAWAANPIDRFVFAKLRDKGLAPSPPADPRQLVRRLTFDLTGLPPAPERVEAFAADPSPAAYAALVEELLASPHYGERWGRHWLDVVRFGESNGFERNILTENAWPYRDYVIRSFNDDKPFDRLAVEHLAGDVVGPGDPGVEVGTTFLVCGPYDSVGQQDAAQTRVIRANTLDDMVRATSEAFLGVTVGCARCHDHKFDPITQQDYHRVAVAFAGVAHGPRPIAPADRKRDYDRKVAGLQARKADLLAGPGRGGAAAAGGAAVAAALADVSRQLAAPPPFPVWWAGQFRPAAGPFPVSVGGDPNKPGRAGRGRRPGVPVRGDEGV